MILSQELIFVKNLIYLFIAANLKCINNGLVAYNFKLKYSQLAIYESYVH